MDEKQLRRALAKVERDHETKQALRSCLGCLVILIGGIGLAIFFLYLLGQG